VTIFAIVFTAAYLGSAEKSVPAADSLWHITEEAAPITTSGVLQSSSKIRRNE
jgi:hypothetical protein